MGYLLGRCPVLHGCCGAPLRAGAALAALPGLLGAALLLVAFAPAGRQALAALGAPARAADAARFVHGALGVLLCAAHVLLLAAVYHQSECQCEVYIWFMIVFWVALLVDTAALAVAAAVANNILFATVFPVVVLASLCVSFYLTAVVANYRTTIP